MDGYKIYNTDTDPETLLFESKYDEDGNFTETINGVTYSYVSSENDYNEQTGITTSTFTIKDRTGTEGNYVHGSNLDYTAQGVTDYFGRVREKTYTSKSGDTVKFSNNVSYGYYSPQANRTSETIVSMNNAIIGENNFSETLNYDYTYDNNGNITEIRENNVLKCKYYYDEANQIVREDSVAFDKTVTYAYDNGGNIVSKTEYEYTSGALGIAVKTTPYTYGDTNWQDKLTSFDGDAITYDEIGNPTSIGDKNYSWTNGRQLEEYEDEDYRIEYTYNADGLRTMKKVYDKDEDTQTGEITEVLLRQYDYVWKNGVLDSAKIIVYDEQTHELYGVISAKYLYDSENTPVGFIYTDPSDNTKSLKAWYVKNLQGDVTEVYVEGEGVAVRYAYDAWGKIEVMPGDVLGFEGAFLAMVVTIANPFTYRGYSFDLETYTYYLQSRYYDPQMGRFLNADGGIDNRSVNTQNMFAYCSNNPVNRYDNGGMLWKELWEGFKTGVRNVLQAGNSAGNTVLQFFGLNTAQAGAFFLMMDKDSQGIYHARFDCWQQYFGFNNAYDFFFDIGTNMLNAKFDFSYNGKNYIFWAWKGDYINLGAGAELGIYTGNAPFWKVDKDLAMEMELHLIYKDEEIISYIDGGKQWWCTAFNPNPKYMRADPSKMTAVFYVHFSNQGMYLAFYNRWKDDSHWIFPDPYGVFPSMSGFWGNLAVLVF